MTPLAGARRLADFLRCAAALGPTAADRWRIFRRLTKNLQVRLGLAGYSASTYRLRTRYGTFELRDNFGDVTNLVSLVWPNAYRAAPLSAPGVILDAGANIGLAAALFRHFNPERPIHCFEPLPEAAALIARNCPGAEVHNVALGAGEGELTLAVDEDGVMASRIPTAWRTSERAFPLVSLDRFAADHDIGAIALLKIDTEGSELELLAGARRTLTRTDRVVLETHGRERHDRVLTELGRAGFVIEDAGFDTDTGMVFARREPGAPAEPGRTG